MIHCYINNLVWIIYIKWFSLKLLFVMKFLTLLVNWPNSDFIPPQLSYLLYYFTTVPMDNCDSGPYDIILEFCCLVPWFKCCLCSICFSSYIRSAPFISDIHTINSTEQWFCSLYHMYSLLGSWLSKPIFYSLIYHFTFGSCM